jgi:pyruvate/2-oxoglutarate/acetoin dehydrogenase E1 component
MKYIDEINRSMQYLAQDQRVIFVGQAVKYPGHAITHQIKELQDVKKLEMPVTEDFQAGFCLGLALEGYIPVCIYPRFNFALLACNMIVNHIDKWALMGGGHPKIIIKIATGSTFPLDPGWQHKGNYTNALRTICNNIDVIELNDISTIFSSYKLALDRQDGKSTILVEHSDMYQSESLFER